MVCRLIHNHVLGGVCRASKPHRVSGVVSHWMASGCFGSSLFQSPHQASNHIAKPH